MSRDWQDRWLNVAQELLPEELRAFREEEPSGTLMRFFFDLLALARQAHLQENEPKLKAIYGFAEWCLRQPEKDIWNAAGVAFWEHVFDDESLGEDVASWVHPWVRDKIEGLWMARASDKRRVKIAAAIKAHPFDSRHGIDQGKLEEIAGI